MGERKHTPGPWSLSWVRGAIRHINKNVDYDAFWFPDEGEDQETANMPNVRINALDANLIAAAPEMFAALDEVERWTLHARAHDCAGADCATCQPSRLREIARAAIGKALGE